MIGKIRYLILTALESVERQEVILLLYNTTTVLHPVTGTDYYVGTLGPEPSSAHIAVARTDQTNVNAGIETERAIAMFQPEYIFFVGIAGGLKDVQIGDVVIGKDVYGFERGKETAVGFLPRPSFGFSSYKMERWATQFSVSEQWKIDRERITKGAGKVKVFTGTIAAGEKIDASDQSQLHQFLCQNCSHALAIEMEGLGFLEACRAYQSINSLLVRGISDLVNNKAATDAEGSQELACRNAAFFVLNFINSIDRQFAADVLMTSELPREIIMETICELYPEGVKHDNIWERSGGALSQLSLGQTTGKSQWFQALKMLSKGGGAGINLRRLLNEMRKDYPENLELLKIIDHIA